MGSPGTGKTHLATSLGIEAAGNRISTYFINFSELMEKFKQASKENRVESVVKHYLKYTVLIIDEIGYLPVDKNASYGFFQLGYPLGLPFVGGLQGCHLAVLCLAVAGAHSVHALFYTAFCFEAFLKFR